jgi:fanconi anemia group J protein
LLWHTQLWCSAWAFSPNNRSILCTYQHLGSFELQDDVGATILHVCRTVPFGVLVFVPSYSLLEKLLARWRVTGVLALMAAIKQVVVEPRNSTQV